jgi:branched-chain amino acid transport system permease protein
VGLQYLLKHTDFGLGAPSRSSKDAAGLMGVNSKRTSAFIYAIYVGVSAMTGVLIGTILSVSAKMGPEYTIFAFFVVVLAGMGYLAGVPAAAFLLGIIQSIFLIYLDPGYTLLAVFGVLYLILLVSPTGLFRKGV